MKLAQSISIILSLCIFTQSGLFAKTKEKVKIETCIRILGGYSYRRDEKAKRVRDTLSFALRNALFDFRKELNEYISARLYVEAAAREPARDIYGAIRKKPFELRIGQFKQGLGIEVATSTPKLDFIEPALITRLRTPRKGDHRDIGAILLYRDNIADAFLAMVNGEGRNVIDKNKWKDLSGRLLIKQGKFTFGGNLYYGKTGHDDTLKTYRALAGEVVVKTPVELTAEYLNLLEDTTKGNGFYVSLVYRQKHWQPLFRYDWLKYGKDKKKEVYTFGINFLPFKEVKIGLNCAIEDKNTWRVLSQFQFTY